MNINSYIRTQRLRVSLAFTLIAMLSLGVFFLSDSLTERIKHRNKISSLINHQYVTAQHLEMLRTKLIYAGSPEERSTLRLQLDSSLVYITQVRNRLDTLLSQPHLPELGKPEISRDSLSQLTRVSNAYFGEMRTLLRVSDDSLNRLRSTSPLLQKNAYQQYIPLLLSMSINTSKSLNTHMVQNRYWNIAFVGITWAILFMTGVLIISPLLKNLVKQIRHAVSLTQTHEQMEQFVFAAAHDLKEPLRTVSNFVQLLQRRYQDKLDEAGNEYIDFAVRNVKRMYALLDDLSHYSKIGYQPLNIVQINGEDLVNEVLEALDSKIFNNKAEIEVGSLPVFRGDRSQIYLLMQNLIDNGIKYHREDVPPRLTVWGEENGDTWKFHVRDNGMGIDSVYHDKVFEFFERVHNPHQVVEGTGMGLALCKKIVKNHQGSIWLESQVGEGSTFSFSILKNLELYHSSQKITSGN